MVATGTASAPAELALRLLVVGADNIWTGDRHCGLTDEVAVQLGAVAGDGPVARDCMAARPESPDLTASFSAGAVDLAATFRRLSGSNDLDGTIVSYDWNFGDGATGSGINSAHTAWRGRHVPTDPSPSPTTAYGSATIDGAGHRPGTERDPATVVPSAVVDHL